MVSCQRKRKMVLKMEKLWTNQDQTLKYRCCWTNSATSRTWTTTELSSPRKCRKIRILWIMKKLDRRSSKKIKLRFSMRTTLRTDLTYHPWVNSETLLHKMAFKISTGQISKWNNSMSPTEPPSKTSNSLKIKIKICTKKISKIWRPNRKLRTTCRQTFRTYTIFSKTSAIVRTASCWRTRSRSS